MGEKWGPACGGMGWDRGLRGEQGVVEDWAMGYFILSEHNYMKKNLFTQYADYCFERHLFLPY